MVVQCGIQLTVSWFGWLPDMTTLVGAGGPKEMKLKIFKGYLKNLFFLINIQNVLFCNYYDIKTH